MNKIIFILLALAAVQASATVVNKCGSCPVDTTSVTLAGCDNPPCKVKTGDTVSYSVKFTPSSPVSDPIARVKASSGIMSFALIDGASVRHKIFKVSDDSPAVFPLEAGVEYIYRDTLTVPNSPFKISGKIELILKSGSKNIKCLVADIQLI